MDLNVALEAFGLVSGLLCVWLLMRQNILTFPLGILYALVTVYLMLQQQLLASALISVYYVGMNAYGWWHWLRGADGDEPELPVTWTPPRERWLLIGLTVVGTFAMVQLLTRAGAELVLWDSVANVLSFVAMWMAARKYVENWVVWFVVDVILCGVYWHQGLYFYLALYAIYLAMAVFGWRAWRAAMAAPE